MTFGRPRHFETPEDMQAAIDNYFADEEQPTMTGLCVAIGITRQTLSDYGKRDDFSNVVKMARATVEAQVEKLLIYDKAGAGAIFWLKNHAGYKDVSEQEVNMRHVISDEPMNEDEWTDKYSVETPSGSAESAD